MDFKTKDLLPYQAAQSTISRQKKSPFIPAAVFVLRSLQISESIFSDKKSFHKPHCFFLSGNFTAFWNWKKNKLSGSMKEPLGKQTYSFHFRCYRPHSGRRVQIKYRKRKRRRKEADKKMKGIGERELEGRRRTSSYLELLSCNLLERRQERCRQRSQTDGSWLWGEGGHPLSAG